MRINIHWGEFCGPVERSEVKLAPHGKRRQDNCEAYKYETELKGYLPFALFKNIQTKQWILDQSVDPAISQQVIFYTKKIIDDFESEYKLLIT